MKMGNAVQAAAGFHNAISMLTQSYGQLLNELAQENDALRQQIAADAAEAARVRTSLAALEGEVVMSKQALSDKEIELTTTVIERDDARRERDKLQAEADARPKLAEDEPTDAAAEPPRLKKRGFY